MSEQKLLDWWLPPEGAGDPVGCLATSFTFDTDFFRDECLGRFIGLRGAIAEEGVGSLAQINELEERLSEVSASVLVDRSASVDGRNLRWDVIPVAVAGGLLHAKTAVLIWQNAVRVIIGSANLTPPGYRYQREFAVALDLTADTPVTKTFWEDYASAMGSILSLVPDDITDMGPKSRAASILDQLNSRIEQADPPKRQSNDRIGLLFSQPGTSAVEQIDSFMGSLRPRRLRAMSPFWDSRDQGSADAIRALTGLLAQRGEVSAELLVPLEATASGSLVHAPQGLDKRVARAQIEVELLGISDGSDSGELDRRRLHAKAVAFESDDLLTIMVGSSNMTAAGLGLHKHAGHIEMNVLYSTPLKSRAARELRALLPQGISLTAETSHVESEDPEEELNLTPLPLGFVAAFLHRTDDQWEVLLHLNQQKLPKQWSISAPGVGATLINHTDGHVEEITRIGLTDSRNLPQLLSVTWVDSEGDAWTADWVLNVTNPADLPLDERLRGISIDLIVQALAQRNTNTSTALERLLNSLSGDSGFEDYEQPSPLDPLKAYDDSRALLKRMGMYGRALDELEVNLSRPVSTPSALGWRLSGLVSPTRLAEGWADQCVAGELPLEMAHFLLAELMLTINRVNWPLVTRNLDQEYVIEEISDLKNRWDAAYQLLPLLPADHELNTYISASKGYQNGL